MTTTPLAPGTARRHRADQLATARLYLCTDGRRARGDLAAFLDEVIPAGVDVVQLREKNLEAAEELALLDVVRTACRRHGALLAVNDRADLAVLAGADVLHVGRHDLTPAQARRVVGPDVLIGVSSHHPAQTGVSAADPDADYVCIGPVWPTPTKPGRPAAGLEAVAEVARRAGNSGRRTPWFAIGGIDAGTLPDVLAAGARRVVVVRAITEAPDPAGAARRLRELLDENRSDDRG